MPGVLKNAKHELFAQAIAIGKNYTEAMTCAGYSPRRGNATAIRAQKAVSDRIAELQQEFAVIAAEQYKKTLATAEEILLELKKIGLADIGEAFDEKGRLRPFHEMPVETRRAIASVEVEELSDGSGGSIVGYTKKVKFWDKPKSLEMLGKNLRLFIDRVAVSKDKSLEDLLAESRKEEAGDA